MDSLRWQWRLPTGQEVAAQLDVETGIESVWVDKKLLSRSGRGGKSGGHRAAVPSTDREVHVSFDFANRACQLILDDNEIPPSSAPARRTLAPTAGVRPRSEAPPAPKAPSGYAPEGEGSGTRVAVIAVMVVSLLASGGFVFFKRGTGEASNAPLSSEITETATTLNGMMTVRFPKPMTVQVNDENSGLVVSNLKGGEIMLLAGMAKKVPYHIGPTVLRGEMAKRLREHFVQRASASGSTYSEVSLADGRCAGYPGMESIGWLSHTTKKVDWKGDDTRGSTERAKMWTCTFMKGDYLYVMAYVVAEDRITASEPVLQSLLSSAVLQPPTTAH